MNASSPSQAKEQDDDTKPLWTYVTKIKSVSGGGNYEIKYNICDFTFNGPYTRVRAHLLKMTGKGVRVCQKVTIDRLIDLKKIDNDATLRVEKSKTKSMSLPPTLDHEIARMFYSSGLPFHLARNPHYRKAFAYAANNQINGYQPPGYNKLRTTLLQNERRHVENLLQPIKNAWSQKDAIDCSNEIKDKDFIAKLMREVIMEVGHSNVVQIVMDNAAVCKAAGLIIEVDFPSIYWTPCVVHTLNLALKNICAAKNIEKKQYKVDYILSFTSPIYDVLRRTDIEASSLHLVYEMWDSMIEKVKNAIYQYERKEESEGSTFYEIVHSILIDRWTKSSTPLHCLAHSLNSRYYSHEWLSEDSNRVPPHQDLELTRERLKCFKRFFLDADVRRKVNIEFAYFSDGRKGFDDLDSLNDRGQMDPKVWWLVHGVNAPILQKVALKLLAQPCSSSCCERNWSTYSFIYSLKRNKMAPHRIENLVFVHSNLQLLSMNTPQYHQEETKMWDVAGDNFGSLDDCGILEIASLSLDEPELEGAFFNDDC
ncbi:hypothetical protein GYH30_011898 [Glycine max]|uniref:HAT C-terminal dimerisation domain-containing protein n=2 Tax=Glycine subgen. Soja TaxID=1462606 RepID=K7KP21_SOYBN|nr:hypothetical protein GYH30_011898 [Glycine max]RZC11440.1 hypothetical protein D0Y65_011572 [Glycine soja]